MIQVNAHFTPSVEPAIRALKYELPLAQSLEASQLGELVGAGTGTREDDHVSFSTLTVALFHARDLSTLTLLLQELQFPKSTLISVCGTKDQIAVWPGNLWPLKSHPQSKASTQAKYYPKLNILEDDE